MEILFEEWQPLFFYQDLNGNVWKCILHIKYFDDLGPDGDDLLTWIMKIAGAKKTIFFWLIALLKKSE